MSCCRNNRAPETQSIQQYIENTVFRIKGLSYTVHSRNQYLTWARSPSAEKSSSRRPSPISPPATWARSGRADHSQLGDHQTDKELGEMHTAMAYRIFPSDNNTESITFKSLGYLQINALSPMKVTDLGQERYGIYYMYHQLQSS